MALIRNHAFYFCTGILLVAVLFFGAKVAYSQTADQVAAREAQLRAELDQVMREIADQQKILSEEQAKGSSFERDIAILNSQIQEAKLKIRAKEIAISGLGKDINQKTETINVLTGKIDLTRESLAELMRKTNEIDSLTLVDVVLSNKDVSEFFADLDAYDSIKGSIQVALTGIKINKENTEIAKQTLEKKRLQEISAKISIETEKKNIEVAEKEKARLLSLSKEQQKNYKNEISKREARASAIRTALFSLRDTSAIPFGKALEYAEAASKQTGVRPAFLLAILSQESELGKNIGTCNRPGDPATKSWRVIMKPSRDQQPYLAITSELGLNPDTMPLSCPLASGGYGGAMGPAQFIPSTWVLFKDRVAGATGHNPPNPWDPKDAFMASAIYLSDLGAYAGDYSGERNAACRYYSGRSCDSKKPANTFYGNSVMTKAANIQTNMIDPLSGL